MNESKNDVFTVSSIEYSIDQPQQTIIKVDSIVEEPTIRNEIVNTSILPLMMDKSSTSGKTRIRKNKNRAQSIQKVDVKAKLERSRQSARECRARKKLRYQYLEDLVNKRENANIFLKKEIDQVCSPPQKKYQLLEFCF